ncbi:hypothetical protein EMCRGX_G011500 [Ephydatia muelleri]
MVSEIHPNFNVPTTIITCHPIVNGGGDYTEEFATYRVDTGVPGHDNQPVFLRKHLASVRVLGLIGLVETH